MDTIYRSINKLGYFISTQDCKIATIRAVVIALALGSLLLVLMHMADRSRETRSLGWSEHSGFAVGHTG